MRHKRCAARAGPSLNCLMGAEPKGGVGPSERPTVTGDAENQFFIFGVMNSHAAFVYVA
jgi:hypothetical protein